MHVSYLSLVDFRSYAEMELSLSPGVTSFLGPNGAGKTNLVEAVAYLATHASHRVAADAPLVRLNAERAVIRARVMREDRPTLIELEVRPGHTNRARINRVPAPRPREALGALRTVLFAPEDLALIKGDPSGRRAFLDELLVARSPRFAAVRADYERVLKQRATLLKSAGSRVAAALARGGDRHTLDVWDSHLARLGAELTAARLELVAVLGPYLAKAYSALSRTGDDATLEYRCSLGPDVSLAPDRNVLAEALLAELSRIRPVELERGVCLIGPHRDDLVLKLGPLPAKGFASQGESTSYALALRLACYDLTRRDGEEPVLILDDVFAELDADRRERLAHLVAGAEQVLVTTAVPADVPKALAGTRVDVTGAEVLKPRC